MTDIDRLHRYLEERARIATVKATPMTSIVHRAKQRDRRRRAAIGALGMAAVCGLAVGAVWMGGSGDTQVRSVDSPPKTVETTPNTSFPVDSSPATLPASTTVAPPTTALVPVDSSPDTLPATTTPAPTPIAPGEEISVTPDLVEFGDRLVGLIGNMDRADGRTYVIVGRYETETDLFFAPEEAVLAAFDDASRELWRTELDRTPTKVVALADDVWVLHETGALSRIDASDGRFIDRVFVGDAWSAFAAFGSVWVYAVDLGGGSGQLIRVRPDMSTTTIELPAGIIANLDDVPPLDPAVDAGGIWVPLGGAGVAVVDVETGQVTVISVDEIGHEVRQVAVDDDVAYVASSDRVTSIVDGQVGATLSLAEISYLGQVEGVFGAASSQGFVVLRADDPMNVEVRQLTTNGWGGREIDGEAWKEEGRNYNLRRVNFRPVSAGDG